MKRVTDDSGFPDRVRISRTLRAVAVTVVVFGGSFWLSVYHGASGLLMIIWVALVPLVWPIHVVLYQWERGRPCRDLLFAPTSREAELALYGRIYCDQAHRVYNVSVVSTPWGKLLLFYAGGVAYLMLATAAYIWARPILMAWIGLFHGLLGPLVDLIPNWRATNAAWMAGGAADIAMFRTHIFGFGLIAALLFLPYQCHCMIAFYRDHRQQFEKHSIIRTGRTSRLWLLVCTGIGWMVAGAGIVWGFDGIMRDAAMRTRRKRQQSSPCISFGPSSPALSTSFSLFRLARRYCAATSGS